MNNDETRDITNAVANMYKKDNGLKMNDDSIYKDAAMTFERMNDVNNNSIDEVIKERPVIVSEWK